MVAKAVVLTDPSKRRNSWWRIDWPMSMDCTGSPVRTGFTACWKPPGQRFR